MEKEPKEKEINVAINLFSGFGQNPDFFLFFFFSSGQKKRDRFVPKKTETPKHVPETEKCFRKNRDHYLRWAARKLDLVPYKISSKDLTYAGFDLLN